MDRKTRSELVRTVENQQDQLKRYENKLRDVVVAYKGLANEKEALEASLKALSGDRTTKTQKKSREKKQVDTELNSPTESEEPTVVVDDKADSATPAEEEDEVSELRQQLVTLTTSLSTVSDEKSKLQASYQAEKKKLKQEKEEAIERLQDEQERLKKEIADLQNEVQQLRNRVRVQQQEREKEQDDHAIMLRELQKLLAAERMAKESMENQLDDIKHAMAEKQASDIKEFYEKQVHNLGNEIGVLRQRLQASENKSEQPSPLLLQLQEEMAAMKASHRIAIQEEQLRARQKEEQLKSAAQNSEDRVSVLEGKLAEISQVISNYEKLRNQDQQAIQKLRERVTQLDMENTALARAASHTGEIDSEDSNLDIHALVSKITSLKGMLKVANERSEKPVNIEELLRVPEWSDMEDDKLHRRCREEYDLLKDEFEKYKLRAQSVLKSKQSKDTNPDREMEDLKLQVNELKAKIRHLRKDEEDQDERYREKLQGLHQTIKNLKETQSHEITNLRAEHKQNVSDVEGEMRKHRDRTISLLAEKDKEIELLRTRSGNKLETQYVSSLRRMSSQVSDDSAPGTPQPQVLEESALDELFTRSTFFGGSDTLQGESSLLHFAQEQARKDVEIGMLRRQKHSLESNLRKQQHVLLSAEEKYTDEVQNLQEEVGRLKRNINRENANLEYLKNVVYNYMVCQDTGGKQAMLKAIATILQFSPRETASVQQLLSSGWWSKPKR